MLIRGVPMRKVPVDFFGTHLIRGAPNPPIGFQTPWVDLGQKRFRIWDNFCTWKKINTADGVYNWSLLYDIASIAKAQHGMSLIYGMGCAPDWATGASTGGSQYSPAVPTDAAVTKWATDLATYNRDVLGPAGCKIDMFELWNEPTDGLFWGGTIAQLIHICQLMYTAIKAVDPTVIVLSPCYPSILSVPAFSNALSAGMADYCDAIAFHAYAGSNPPEYLDHVVRNYLGVLKTRGVTKPVYDTEGGFITYTNTAGVSITGNTSADVMSDAQGSAYVSRRCIVMAGFDLEASFYYAPDGQVDGSYQMKPTMLDYATRSIKQPAALAFEYAARTIAGGYMGAFSHDGRKYSSRGETKDGARFTALWCRDRETVSVNPAAFGAVSARDCRGAAVDISNGSLTVTLEPVFLWT